MGNPSAAGENQRPSRLRLRARGSSLLAIILPALILGAGSQRLRGDSIDDAEARRRGVPVAQVQVENALAKEKARVAALEKQAADLQKKLAELSPQTGPAASAPAASRPAASQTAPAADKALDFSGPREASPLYDDFVKRYLDGNWNTLTADMATREKEIAALAAGNRADLTYIRQTLAECRPAWWDQAKRGAATQVQQTVWKHSANILLQNADHAGLTRPDWNKAPLSCTISVPLADLDSSVATDLMYIGIGHNGPVNFTRADGVNFNLWGCIGVAEIFQQVDTRKLTAAELDQFSRYAVFWQSITSLYYGTPPARRLAMVQSATYHNLDVPLDTMDGFRPIASEFLIEIKTHLQDYKNLPVDESMFYRDPPNRNEEYFLADGVISSKMLQLSMTLEQDRALRDIAARLAKSNPDWRATKIKLSHDLRIDLRTANDAADLADRLKFLNIPRH